MDGFEQPPKSEQLLKKSVYVVAMTGGPTSNASEEISKKGTSVLDTKKLLWHLGARTFQLHHTKMQMLQLYSKIMKNTKQRHLLPHDPGLA